jgi:hypothetical protein
MSSMVLLVTLMAAVTGCYRRARVAYVEEYDPPPDVVSYPYVVYEGRPVYYVRGRYYYRRGPRWVYYSEPPRDLRSRRFERRAPPAYREAPRRRQVVAPPARRESRREEEETPPPATRVR